MNANLKKSYHVNVSPVDVGGQPFGIAGGLLNMHVVAHIHRVYR